MTVALKDPVQNHLANLQQLRQGVVEVFTGGKEHNAHKAELVRCATDTVYFVDTYCKTYDPRTPGKSMAFKLWPRQKEFLLWLKGLKDEASQIYPTQVMGLC